MVKLETALSGVNRLFLDTAPVIYLVEQNPQFFEVIRALFEKVDKSQLVAVASPITLAECLVGAYRTNQTGVAANFNACLTQSETELISISAEIGDRAARLRVAYKLSLTDALQIATALKANCDAFLTNDVQLKRIRELKILLINELEI